MRSFNQGEDGGADWLTPDVGFSDQGEMEYISKRSVFKFRDCLYFFFVFFFHGFKSWDQPYSQLVAGLCRNSVVDRAM